MNQDMPEYLQVPLYEMPLKAQMWALYVFGILAVLTLEWAAFRDRVFTSRQVWMILLAIVVSAWIYEAPLTTIGFRDYYGASGS